MTNIGMMTREDYKYKLSDDICYIQEYLYHKNNNDFTSIHDVMYNIISSLVNKMIPTYPIDDDYYSRDIDIPFYITSEFIRPLQGYVALTNDFIDTLANYLKDKKCLEIMAGCGSLSKVLQDRGIDIIATDDYSWKDNSYDTQFMFSDEGKWTDVHEMDAISAIKQYGKDIDYILCSWAYMDDLSFRCLNTMRDITLTVNSSVLVNLTVDVPTVMSSSKR